MSAPANDPSLLAIDVQKLSFSYADEPALHSIDLAIPQGSRVLCIGANGGASTGMSDHCNLRV